MSLPAALPRIAVILLNYRTGEMTLRALAAAARAMQGLAGEIIVVDNDSRDGSFEMLSARAQGCAGAVPVRVLQTGHNGGFGAGNNHGIRAALASEPAPGLVYLLNSDAFPQPDAIRVLAERLLLDPSAGLAGSFIHGADGETHVTAFRFPSIAGEFEGAARFGPISRALARYRVPLPVPEATRRVDWLAGASLMIRAEVLAQIGDFDEDFFLYFEETDLCRRAADAGFGTLYVRESVVEHIGSVSTGMKGWTRVPGYWFRSRRHYFTKTHGRLYAALATGALVSGVLVRRMRALVQPGRGGASEPRRFLRDLLLGGAEHDTQADGDVATPNREPKHEIT